MKTLWTIETIRENLPDVAININGKIKLGRLAGRILKFPFIIITETNQRFEVSWNVIERSLNTLQPIQI